MLLDTIIRMSTNQLSTISEMSCLKEKMGVEITRMLIVRSQSPSRRLIQAVKIIKIVKVKRKKPNREKEVVQ